MPDLYPITCEKTGTKYEVEAVEIPNYCPGCGRGIAGQP
jgi:predicted Zn-ribbon and HTH transcriptional regulator